MDCRKFLGASTHRRLVLIETLYGSDRGVNNDELLREMKCTLPILLNDVRVVNETHTECQIRKIEGFYYLEKKRNSGLAGIYAQVITTAPEFQILEALLYEKHQTLTELANSLYLSTPNTQRMVDRLKKILLPLQIHLKHRPLRLVGNEAMIRHLFYRYFTEKNAELTIELPNLRGVHKDIIVDFIHEFIDHNQLIRVYVFYQRLVYNFFISAWRIRNKHHFPKGFLQSSFPRIPVGPARTSISFLLRDQFDSAFNEEICRDLMWLIYSDGVVFSREHLQVALSENDAYRELYSKHEQLIEKCRPLFADDLSNKTRRELILALQNACFIYEKNLPHCDVLVKAKCRFVQDLWKKHPQTVEQIKQVVLDHQIACGHYYVENDFILTLVYWIITTIPNSIESLERNKGEVRILFISVSSPTEERFLANEIAKKIVGNISVHFLEGCGEEYIQKVKAYDLVLTTGMLAEEKIKVPLININSCLLWRELEQIQLKVNELLELKKQLNTADIREILPNAE